MNLRDTVFTFRKNAEKEYEQYKKHLFLSVAEYRAGKRYERDLTRAAGDVYDWQRQVYILQAICDVAQMENEYRAWKQEQTENENKQE